MKWTLEQFRLFQEPPTPRTHMENYYKLLGVDQRASLGEIAEAFKLRWGQLQNLPPSPLVDKARETLKLAVTFLGNIAKRNEYDRLLNQFLQKEKLTTTAATGPELVNDLNIQCPNCPNSTFIRNADPNQEYRCFFCNSRLPVVRLIKCHGCQEKSPFEGRVISCKKCGTLLHNDPNILKTANLSSRSNPKTPLSSSAPSTEGQKSLPHSPINATIFCHRCDTKVPFRGEVVECPNCKNDLHPDPDVLSEFKRTKGQTQSPPPTDPPPPPPASPTRALKVEEISIALKKLKELADMGILTPEEFDRKKQELISRI